MIKERNLPKKKALPPDNVPPAQDHPAPEEENYFPIVGIGASAGGLETFEAFFAGMPAGTDPGMAFILVQHLAPDHKSILADLVSRYTRMQVHSVEEGMEVKPNCVYIIPPNRDMALLNGTLHLLEQTALHGMRLPIDFFFRSLAHDRTEWAIGIILSGTGSDGTMGVRAIKGEGGMVIVQDPSSAVYDGMPRNAIATGVADYILRPAEMATQLIGYVNHVFGSKLHPLSSPGAEAQDALKKICLLLRAQTGHDFSKYKSNTMIRRVDRRMAFHHIEQTGAYVRYLQKNPEEVTTLFRDLLIGVTQFFRDPEAFTALEKQVIPQLFDGKPAGATIRAWIVGCSTGEEAYSIAILLQEQGETLKKGFKVQVFATDMDSRAIDTARAGLYPASITADISKERLTRFFSREPGGEYRIHRSLRDLLVFSEQDVIKDPPFSKIDLISCRNVLIYMSGELQQKLIPLFHYALNPGGVLLLGSSETVGDYMELFAALNRKWKLYQKKKDDTVANRLAVARLIPFPTGGPNAAPLPDAGKGDPSVPLGDLVEQALLQFYAPASVLVNGQGDIYYIHGRTGKYLEPPPGGGGMNILRMAREGLRRALSTALHKAATGKETVHFPGLHVKTNGDYTTIRLSVRPLSPAPDAAVPGLLLVSFQEMPDEGDARAARSGRKTASPAESHPGTDRRVAALEQDLRSKEEYLQATIEEMETSHEELKSSNEEMQSVNEELQSTNEELETSKEELQSVNEELATINIELQQKVLACSQVNNDMNNLLAGTGVGTIFVDHQLNIRRFTPAATSMINLIQTDIGRPLSHIVPNIVGYDRLLEDTQAVLDDLVPKEIEVKTKTDDWYLLRIRPYRTLENVIEGAVITFFEITKMRKVKETMEREASPS